MAATYKACIDESIDPNKVGLAVVGGMIATQRQWRSFRSDWRKELKRSPSIPHFHASDANRHDKMDSLFYGWGERAIRGKVERLARIVAAHSSMQVVAVVQLADFWHVAHRCDWPDRYYDPYYMGFTGALMLVSGYMMSIDAQRHRPVIVFDRCSDSQKERNAMDMYFAIRDADVDRQASLVSAIKMHINKPQFRDDIKDEIGLQGADLIAYEYRRAVKHHKKPPRAFTILGRPVRAHVWGRKEVDQWRWAVKQIREASDRFPRR
jgi:hypothetical protein